MRCPKCDVGLCIENSAGGYECQNSECRHIFHPKNECLECGSDLSSGFHNDGCSHNGFYTPWPKVDISEKGGHQ